MSLPYLKEHFTFNLKDKYGYKSEVNIEYENFDETSGMIEYALSSTAKTNKPVTLTITATDDQSGVGEVKLLSKKGEISVTDSGGEYTAPISENGAYSIVNLLYFQSALPMLCEHSVLRTAMSHSHSLK